MTWARLDDYLEYEIQRSGELRRIERGGSYPAGYRLTQWVSNNGYPCYTVKHRSGKTRAVGVHQLLAAAFLQPRPSIWHEVAHNDGDRRNYAVENLRWATRRENVADKNRHGTQPRGDRHPNSKLTYADAAEIRAAVARGESGASQSRRFNVSPSAIQSLLRGSTWVAPGVEPAGRIGAHDIAVADGAGE